MRLSSGRAAASILAGILSVSLAAAGCSLPSPDGVAPTTSTNFASVDELADGDAGYELEILELGPEPRRVLSKPAPIGAEQKLAVTIQTTSSGQQTSVSAVVSVVVDRSRADGASDSLVITTLESSASDTLMSEALQASVGGTTVATRGSNRVVETLRGDEADESIDRDAGKADFWATQLREAAVSLAGPLPTDPIGLPSSWAVTFVATDGARSVATHKLTELTGERYVVEFTRTVADGSWTGRFEGTIGQAVPDTQAIQIGDTMISVSPVAR